MSKTNNKDSKDLDRVLDIVNIRLSQLSFSPLNRIEMEIIKANLGSLQEAITCYKARMQGKRI